MKHLRPIQHLENKPMYVRRRILIIFFILEVSHIIILRIPCLSYTRNSFLEAATLGGSGFTFSCSVSCPASVWSFGGVPRPRLHNLHNMYGMDSPDYSSTTLTTDLSDFYSTGAAGELVTPC